MYDAADVEPMQVAQDVRQDLITSLQPVLGQLDAQIDRRLVQTFVRTIAVPSPLVQTAATT